jgi:uncharacterized BrkB/YihY/UPF0761 family membrane protein
VAILLARLGVPLSWSEIFRRTWKECLEDNCLGMAAQLAYYFFFALFPALLALLALASYFPLETLVDDTLRLLGGFAPREVLTIVTDQIRTISGLAILAGAEMNAEIEHASPYGKHTGENVPDEKRRHAA